MAFFEKEVTVDLSAENKYNCIAVKQGDFNSRFIRMTVLADGVKFDFPENEIAYLRCLHENGTFDIAVGTINDDTTISFEIPKKVIANSGTAICDLSFVKGTESTLSSSVLTLVINKSALGGKVETDDGIKTPSELFAMMSDAMAKSHEHNNKEVLDKLSLNDENSLIFNGEKIGGSLEIKTIELSTSYETGPECMMCPFYITSDGVDFAFNGDLFPQNIVVLNVDFYIDGFWYSGIEVVLSGRTDSNAKLWVYNYPEYSLAAEEGYKIFATISDSSGSSDLSADASLVKPNCFKKVRIHYLEV